MSNSGMRLILSVVLTVALSVSLPTSLTGKEPAREFLNALINSGYYDLAIDYLDSIENNRLAPASFRETIRYEKAIVLIEGATTIRDETKRTEQLNDAEILLNEFIRTRKTHALASVAQGKLANLLFQRANMNVLRAKKPNTPNAFAQDLLTTARKQFDQSSETLAATREDLKKKLERIPVQTKDETLEELRDRYRTEYLSVRILLPVVQEQQAETFGEGSPERTALLESAAEEYENYASDYQARFPGAFFRGRLYQGRCFFKLKKYDESLAAFNDIFDVDSEEEALRKIKRDALQIAMECWLQSEPKKYFNLIEVVDPLVLSMRPNEETDSRWQFIELTLSKTYREAAEYLKSKEEKSPNDRKLMAVYTNKSEDLARSLTRVPGPYKRDAQQLLADWGVSRRSTTEETEKEPTNFAEAVARAKKLLDAFEVSRVLVGTVETRLQNETDANEIESLKNQLAANEQIVADYPLWAIGYYKKAFELADADVSVDELGNARYYMCYMLRWAGREYDAISLGEYQLQRYPHAKGSRASADLILSALWVLYSAATDDTSFEVSHLTLVSDLILEHWQGEVEAIKAARIMNTLMLRDLNLERADHYLQQIPESAPERVTATVDTGNRMWSRFLEEKKLIDKWEKEGLPPGTDLAAKKAELNQLKTVAASYLESGLKSLDQNDIDRSRAIASLRLVSAYLELGQVDKALLHLENKRSGPLTLVRQNHSSAAQDDFKESAYRVALGAYLRTLQTTSNPASRLQKVEEALAALSKIVGDSPTGKNKLASTCAFLASDLKKRLDATQSPRERKSMSFAVAYLLDKIGTTSTQLSLLIWSGAALTELGESFAEVGSQEEAKAFYVKSEAILLTILDQGQKQKGWLGEAEEREIVRRLARIKKNQGEYQDAIGLYVKVLKEKTLIDVQVEAAETYQQWAASKKSATYYAKAMLGGEERTDPKTKRKANMIWGWGKLAQTTARYDQYRKMFFQARLNLAECRFGYAELKKSDKYREMAKRDLVTTYKLYPELGGEEMKLKYESLLVKIQKSLGESAKGFAAL